MRLGRRGGAQVTIDAPSPGPRTRHPRSSGAPAGGPPGRSGNAAGCAGWRPVTLDGAVVSPPAGEPATETSEAERRDHPTRAIRPGAPDERNSLPRNTDPPPPLGRKRSARSAARLRPSAGTVPLGGPHPGASPGGSVVAGLALEEREPSGCGITRGRRSSRQGGRRRPTFGDVVRARRTAARRRDDMGCSGRVLRPRGAAAAEKTAGRVTPIRAALILAVDTDALLAVGERDIHLGERRDRGVLGFRARRAAEPDSCVQQAGRPDAGQAK